MSYILETRGLTHVYGAGTPFERKALDAVDIAIKKGEILGVIGHTGSGKSTLIQHFNGLLKPTSGEVLLDGQSIWNKDGKWTEESPYPVQREWNQGADNFAYCLRTGDALVVGPEAGARSRYVLDMMYKSAESGEWIELEER